MLTTGTYIKRGARNWCWHRGGDSECDGLAVRRHRTAPLLYIHTHTPTPTHTHAGLNLASDPASNSLEKPNELRDMRRLAARDLPADFCCS